VQSQPPGRFPFRARHLAGRGGETGPGLWRTCCTAQQGPCRNPHPKHLPRSVRIAAGATRAEGPEEGQVDKPTPACLRGRRLSDGDAIRRVPGRARVAPPIFHLFRRHSPRAALRTSIFPSRRLLPRGIADGCPDFRPSRDKPEDDGGEGATMTPPVGRSAPESKRSPAFPAPCSRCGRSPQPLAPNHRFR